MDETCINCGKLFSYDKKRKSYGRRSIDSQCRMIPLLTYRDILNSISQKQISPSKKFVCEKCASLCVKVHKQSKFSKRPRTPGGTPLTKRPRVTSTPISKAKSSTPTSKLRKMTSTPTYKLKKDSSSIWRDKVITCIGNGYYGGALKLMYKKSSKARECIKKFIADSINAEVTQKSVEIGFSVRPTFTSLANFTWARVFPELTRTFPILMTALQGSLTTNKDRSKVSVDRHTNIGELVPVCGFLASIILHKRKPKTYDYLQTAMSLEMYKSGCSQKLFRWFQKLGLCKGVEGTRAMVDKLTAGHDHRIREWQTDLERDLGRHVPTSVPQTNESSASEHSQASEDEVSLASSYSSGADLESSDESDPDFQPLPSSTDDEEPDVDELGDADEERNPGYSVCWDNVQKMSITRHHLQQENKMMLWALCFAAQNRISFRHLDCVEDRKSISEIPMHCYLPSEGDYQQLRMRMENVVQRVVKSILNCFADVAVDTIGHKYLDSSMKKSDIVNLGVLKENPASARGTIEILKYLHQYVPKDMDGKPYPILVHGDQLSVERMIEAKLAMSYSDDSNHRLSGLVPRPQGFHKRCVILQDSMKMLYHGKNVANPGSLFHIRNKFNFRNVKAKISDCINHVVDLFTFTVEGLICLLLCELLDIENIDVEPTVPQDKLERQEFFSTLCRKILDRVWPSIEMETIEDVCHGEAEDTLPYTEDADASSEIFEDTDVPTASGPSQSTPGPSQPVSGSSQPVPGPSENAPSPSQPALGPASHPAVTPLQTRASDDAVQQYTCCLLWRGLLHIAQTDAERHNNGDFIVGDWRLDMVEFWNQNHYKYLILGHRLLAGINGWLPARLRQEMMWNSTANIHGGAGHNVALDLVNEFLNNEFKSNLKNSHGQYTEQQVQRCSKIVGSTGKAFEEIFERDILRCPSITHKSSSRKPNIEKLKKFVSTYKEYNLLKYSSSDRHHTGLAHFKNVIKIHNPEKLKARLNKYKVVLENEEYLLDQ